MARLKNILSGVDWPLLLFLAGITYVKLYVKLAAVLLYSCYLLYKRTRFYKANRIHYFYLLTAFFAGVVATFNGSIHNPDYKFAFVIGELQWLIAFAGAYLVYISVIDKQRTDILNLFKVFFAINAMISFGALLSIMVEMGGAFPYWSSSLKYGISTGDYIRGVFSDSSIANAAVCAAGGLYFLRYKEVKWAVLCLLTMMLCTSNITVLLFVMMLVGLLFFGKRMASRKQVLFTLLVTLVFYPLLSIQNMSYISLVFKRGVAENYQLGAEPLVSTDDKVELAKHYKRSGIYNPYYNDIRIGNLSALLKTNRYYATSTPKDKPFFASKEFYANIDKYRADILDCRTNISGDVWALKNGNKETLKRGYALDPELIGQGLGLWYDDSVSYSVLERSKLPGKLYAHVQTYYYNRTNYSTCIMGAGLGRFSSKLAIKMTGLGLQGSYPEGKVYLSAPFVRYHFHTLLYYLSQHAGAHSVANMPNSVYNQILGEYGLIGLLLFLLLYLGFFWKNRKKLRPLLPLLLLLLLLFEVEYWFEVLSLTIVFELMIFSEFYTKTEHE